MIGLAGIIASEEPATRNTSLAAYCKGRSAAALLEECHSLDRFWRENGNLYERARAQIFLYAIYRYYLPRDSATPGKIPPSATAAILQRRFTEAIDLLLAAQQAHGPSPALFSALAPAYYNLCFETLRGQVRRSVRAVRGNQWMSRTGHPADYPLVLRPELLEHAPGSLLYPILRETTPVRMDLTHSGWSDIFFLGMDYPEAARVINISVDLAVRGAGSGIPAPPVEAWLRVVDEPVIRLTSVDLEATADITTLQQLFEFGRDHLGLLKAAVIASGLVPQALEGSTRPLSEVLEQLIGKGRGIELVSVVRGIPKGSRLAVSTNLLASLIAVCMRATRQTACLTGALAEADRRLVAARAVLGEWLGGSGGGWQDSGGVWPGIKVMRGEPAREGDPEFHVSRGRLLPSHQVLAEDLAPGIAETLQNSLVVVHGGMAQDVGPVLEMVTEKYLLRSPAEWEARAETIEIFDEILASLKSGDMHRLATATHRNFTGPLRKIIPWATNLYTETLISSVTQEMGDHFWGFWMLGGMSGGGMGFIFHPDRKAEAQAKLAEILTRTKRSLESTLPFAMDPIVYDFAINESGTSAQMLQGEGALMPPGYYNLHVPSWLRAEPRSISPLRRAELAQFGSSTRQHPALSQTVQNLFDRMLPANDGPAAGGTTLASLLTAYGFDHAQHEQIRTDLRSGRLGLAQNRMPLTMLVEDVRPGDVDREEDSDSAPLERAGEQSLSRGEVAVLTLAGGAGSRWTRGAGVIKALYPFCVLAGTHRSFLDVHIAKNRQTKNRYGAPVPHIVTTSHLTHEPVERALSAAGHSAPGPVALSQGRNIGLRMVPMVRDLRFAWEEQVGQVLDEQAEKVRESVRASLLAWVAAAGEASDYTDNLPLQCLHPPGHWFEIPNLLRNGALLRVLDEQPSIKHLLLHNVDTVGANLDPRLLGVHLAGGGAMTVEVIQRHFEDQGGGLARVDGKLRLVEGLALPSEELEASLSYYNSNTMWIDVDKILQAFELTRESLSDPQRVRAGIRRIAGRIPAYITLKDVKKRWGKGQEDIFPVAQFEKLWGDMTALPELTCHYTAVPRRRGQQLKAVSQLDGWLRDGSAAFVESLCDWE